jgi:dephospho-CoA kinase
MEVPLLVESGWRKGEIVVVVDCPEDLAVERVVAQRGMAPEEVRRRIAAQATREERLARADHVIVNDGTLEDLRLQVEELWERLDGIVTGGS